MDDRESLLAETEMLTKRVDELEFILGTKLECSQAVRIESAELWTILAALQWYLQCGFTEGSYHSTPRAHALATNGGKIVPPTKDAVITLAERLNGADLILVEYPGHDSPTVPRSRNSNAS